MDKNTDKEFNFNKFWGSPLIEPHVVFRRNSNMYCVYCGDKADTREHCPSKAFLNKPYPTDLPTVPACNSVIMDFQQMRDIQAHILTICTNTMKIAI